LGVGVFGRKPLYSQGFLRFSVFYLGIRVKASLKKGVLPRFLKKREGIVTKINSRYKKIPSISLIKSLFETSKMVRSPLQVLNAHAKELGENYFYRFGGVKKVLVSTDPVVLKHILKSNHINYKKSDIQTEHMKAFLSDGLLTSHGESWFKQRKLMNEGFRPKALHGLIEIMTDCLRHNMPQFKKNLLENADLASELTSLTFSMAARSLFGSDVKDDEIKTISDAISKIQGFIVKNIVQPYAKPWFYCTGQWQHYQGLREKSDAIIFEKIKQRKSSGIKNDDILQILIDTVYEDTGKAMTDKQLLSEIIQLLVAAHETSSNTLCWMIYLLCEYSPESFDRLRVEFESVVGHRTLHMDDLNLLSFAKSVINETLRMYPPFWMIDRVAINDDEIDGVIIPANTTLIALVYGVQNSSNYWDKPDMFIPDRHMNNVDNKKTKGITFLPFGTGPRTCIGSKYAMLQMLMVMKELIFQLDFEIDSLPDMNPMVILKPSKNVKLKVSKR